MPDAINPYKILQVDPEAEDEVITAAYRRLARKYHPDLAEGPDASARMAAINAAWELIGDPAKRAAYDRMRRASVGDAVRRGSQDSGARSPGPGDSRSEGGGPAPRPATPPPPEFVSPDWTSGRSSHGGGFDDSMRAPQGHAGPPPGRPSGRVLNFGRYAGWSLGEIARHDLEYIEWLDRMPIGRPYRDEIDGILRSAGRRRSEARDADDRRGLYRRR
jgi:curved DNA-binding protein CbpA